MDKEKLQEIMKALTPEEVQRYERVLGGTISTGHFQGHNFRNLGRRNLMMRKGFPVMAMPMMMKQAIPNIESV